LWGAFGRTVPADWDCNRCRPDRAACRLGCVTVWHRTFGTAACAPL